MSDQYDDCIVVDSADDLIDGDRIVGCRSDPSGPWNRSWEYDGVVVGKGKWTLEKMKLSWPTQQFQIRRAGGAKPSEAVAVPSASPWNGKCSKCKKGTYTGLFKTEHEGGRCLGT